MIDWVDGNVRRLPHQYVFHVRVADIDDEILLHHLRLVEDRDEQFTFLVSHVLDHRVAEEKQVVGESSRDDLCWGCHLKSLMIDIIDGYQVFLMLSSELDSKYFSFYFIFILFQEKPPLIFGSMFEYRAKRRLTRCYKSTERKYTITQHINVRMQIFH